MADLIPPGAGWQFWSNPQVRPKRSFEALLLFGDLIFGGEGIDGMPPFIVKAFSRPGFSRIETQNAKYQLRSGDFAQIDYPTGVVQYKPLTVTLADVNISGKGGPDTAGHITSALSMMQKTWKYEEAAMAQEEGASNVVYERFINAYVQANPEIVTILELDGKGGTNGEWSIYKPVLTGVEFSEINYDTSQFGTVRLTFAYKNFKFGQRWAERQLDKRLTAAEASRQKWIGNWIMRGTQWLANTY